MRGVVVGQAAVIVRSSAREEARECATQGLAGVGWLAAHAAPCSAPIDASELSAAAQNGTGVLVAHPQ